MAFPGEVTKRQYCVEDYKVDMFFPEHNIVVECDEHGHCSYSRAKEEARTNTIKEVLDNPVIVRFNPDAQDFDMWGVIGQIYQHLRASLVRK